MKSNEVLIAGFGGQGILFAGKLLAYAGLIDGKEVSWLPSYGPEMRGGTANCSVIISDMPVGSPLITNPTILIAMNGPSLDKFEKLVPADGIIIYDSALIKRAVERDNVRVFPIPATEMGGTLANMIMIGKLIKEAPFLSVETIGEAMNKVVSAKRKGLIETNMDAVKKGFDFN